MTVTTPIVTFYQLFARGDMPSGNRIVVLENDGVTQISCQQDQEVTWSDGSLRGAAISFVSPDTFAPSQSIPYKLGTISGAPDRIAFLTLSQLAADTDFKVQLTGFDLGADVWQMSVNDVIANGTAFPWGTNPVHGWQQIRSGPICCEWKFWGLVKRVSDSAYHKWIYVGLWVRAWSGGSYEVGGYIRQSNIYGPHPSGSVGSDPQPSHTFQATLFNGANALYYWGGPNDTRAFTVQPADFNTSNGEITTPATNPISANQSAGFSIPVTFSSTGTLPGGLSANTLYWIASNGGNAAIISDSRYDSLGNYSNSFSTISITSQGTGTISVTPYIQTFPFCALYLMDVNGERIFVNGTKPTILVGPDFLYLTQKTKLIPTYLSNTTINPLTDSTAAFFSPMSAQISWYLEGQGDDIGDERVGYFNNSGCRLFFIPTDPYEVRHNRSIALEFGEWHYYDIDEKTGTYANWGNRTYPNFGAPLGDNWNYGNTNNPPSAPIVSPSTANRDLNCFSEDAYWGDASHMPAPWASCYMLWGDDIFLEMGRSCGNVTVAATPGHQTINNVDYYHLTIANQTNQARAMAWGLRTTFLTRSLIPSTDPTYQFWQDYHNDCINYLNNWVTYAATTNEKSLGYYDEYGSNGQSSASMTDFQFNFFYLTLAMVHWSGESDLTTFLTHFNKYYIGKIDSTMGYSGCLWATALYVIYPFTNDNATDANLITTNFNDVYTNSAQSSHPDWGYMVPWTGCPATGLADSSNSTNSYTDSYTSALAIITNSEFSSIPGCGNALTLYNDIRARQTPVDWTDNPRYSAAPIGATS